MINKKFLALGVVVLALGGFIVKTQSKGSIMYPKYEVLAQQINCDIAQELAKLYDLHPCGTGGSIHEKVEEMFLALDCYRKLNVQEARRLIVACALKYMEAFNSDVEIRPHLSRYPFSANNIELAIAFYCPDREFVEIGELVTVDVLNGRVNYSIRKAEHGHERIHFESFEEALKIVEEEKKGKAL